jgi:hypothetical protein
MDQIVYEFSSRWHVGSRVCFLCVGRTVLSTLLGQQRLLQLGLIWRWRIDPFVNFIGAVRFVDGNGHNETNFHEAEKD